MDNLTVDSFAENVKTLSSAIGWNVSC
jgi:hypothetical protein